jgi:hypothetical protein
MSGIPRKIGFYALQPGGMRKVAEYAWTDAGVGIEVLDEKYERMARGYFTEGILLQRIGKLVTAEHPELFMEALVEPRNMSYYDFRPES